MHSVIAFAVARTLAMSEIVSAQIDAASGQDRESSGSSPPES
jgi:hypothetical protein